MFRFLLSFLLVVLLSWSNFFNSQNSGCSPDVSICTSGVAGPFIFDQNATGPPADYADPTGCSTGMFGNDFGFGFIILYITESGPLNLLVDGDSDDGFIDVVVYNIPEGVTPCDAVMNSNNEIGCNYATDICGCTQFGTDFDCPSSIPAPNVIAGQRIMIIVHDYSTMSNSFTLELGPTGSQTGPPVATIDPVAPICNNAGVTQLTSINSGGIWSGNGITAEGIFDPSLAGIGVHTINYKIGTLPCADSAQIQIEVIDCTPVSCENDVQDMEAVCIGELVNLISITNGTSFEWTGPNYSSTEANPTGVSLPGIAGSYTYVLTVQIHDSICTDSTLITVLPKPIINAGQDVVLCQYDNYLLNAVGVGSIVWSNGIANNEIFQPNTGITNLIATITDSLTCTNTDTLEINVIENVPLTFSVNRNVGCTPIEVEFQNTSLVGLENKWFANGNLIKQNSDFFMYTFDDINCYDIRLEINAGTCSYEVTYPQLICDFPIPTPNFEFYENILSLEEVKLVFTNTSQNATIYSWDFGDNSLIDSLMSPTHLFDVSEISSYEIELFASNEYGCIDSITKKYTFQDFVYYFIPNTFSPNGDELNNVFKPVFYGEIDPKEYFLKIYNKWGNLLFESKDSKIGWDGTFNSSIVKSDTYVWIIEFTEDKTNSKINLDGFVNLRN